MEPLSIRLMKRKNQPMMYSKRAKSRRKQHKFVNLLLIGALISLTASSFPPAGKCSYYILPSPKTFSGQPNDPQAIQNTNNCPQSSSSFRVSIFAKLTSNVLPSESAILFAYHNLIQIFIKRDGTGHKVEIFKKGEANGGLLLSESIGKLNWQFFLFL